MTTQPRTFRRKQKIPELTPGQFCFGLFSIFCLFLILRNSDTAIEYMNRGLRLCAKTVIPSLFPFMVISELIVSGGIGSTLIRPLAPLFRRLFRIPEAGCCAVLLGMLCGFPVGAKSAMTALDQGQLTREEAERVLTFSNNPSSAFLINAVGVSLWGNRKFGVALYIVVLVSQVLTGILFAHLPRRAEAAPELLRRSPTASRSGAAFFTDAVRSACFSMLLVCAYVIFFSALVGTLNLLLDALNLPALAKASVFCIFELSGGMSAASALSVPGAAALLCAFAAGWSGLSVHCQILSVCDGRGLRFRFYFLAKLLQSGLCMLLFGAVLALFPSLTVPAQQTAAVALPDLLPLPIMTVIFLAALVFVFLRKSKKTQKCR